ncbi:5-hydroxytryptamine receptor 2A-like [Morone saxatilis]|uniref:5-hydroxytryptamine receptor 2A-like n=1 Tax=Morone saxatilis TaxID=34816 RepID=UPI0015E24B13|nr:5-hydroxytryptamine receptor 2A-like [Morone saxatilis]
MSLGGASSHWLRPSAVDTVRSSMIICSADSGRSHVVVIQTGNFIAVSLRNMMFWSWPTGVNGCGYTLICLKQLVMAPPKVLVHFLISSMLLAAPSLTSSYFLHGCGRTNQEDVRTRRLQLPKEKFFHVLMSCFLSAGISMPIPVLGLRDHSKVFKDGSCLLTDNNFVLVGSFVAFFVPLTIMVVTYFLTINALQNEATLCLDQLVPRPKWSTTFTLSFLPQTSLSSEKLFRRSISREAGGRGSSSGLGGARGSVSGSLFGRRTMQSISNEQKASKVLGVVFLLFVVMWCPFFITNVLVVVCNPVVCDAGLMGGLLNVFVWVGYLSSAVNPLVYTLFNKTYRAAFLRYVRCQYQPEKKPLQLILVNTIPPLAYSSTQLPLGNVEKIRNGDAHSSGEVKDFSLPGQETEMCRPDKRHRDKDESCV